MIEDQERIERLLARGQPSGPRMDRLWERLAPQVVERPARVTLLAWLRSLGVTLIPLAPVTAVVLLLVANPVTPPLIERGEHKPMPPLLETTCGTVDQPCHVGVPIYLRLAPRHAEGVVYVRLKQQDGSATLLAGPLPVKEQTPVAVPVRLVPEENDVGAGLELEALWLAEPVPAGKPRKLDEVPSHARSVLRLTVAP